MSDLQSKTDEELNRMLSTILSKPWRPNYCADLNAVAEEERDLRPCDMDVYVESVGEIVREHWLRKGKRVAEFSDRDVIFAHMTATARQRTIALIQTLTP